MVQANSWDRQLQFKRQEQPTHSPILTPEEARQGVISGRVRMVLAVSLMLVIAAFAVVFIVSV
jgi:hypothetical protein